MLKKIHFANKSDGYAAIKIFKYQYICEPLFVWRANSGAVGAMRIIVSKCELLYEDSSIKMVKNIV